MQINNQNFEIRVIENYATNCQCRPILEQVIQKLNLSSTLEFLVRCSLAQIRNLFELPSVSKMEGLFSRKATALMEILATGFNSGNSEKSFLQTCLQV